VAVSDAPIIGIDLGTTFSAVAHLNDSGMPEILANQEGERTTPSVVFFDASGIPVVGQAARNIARTEPDRVVQFIKRQMGNSSWLVNIDGIDYVPEAISACILKKLKNDAEDRLGTPVERAVISVPAYFKDGAKSATHKAGEIAELDVVALVNEPTAAAIAYGLASGQENGHGKQTLLVYDFGGGTFDVTILRVDGPEFTVVATDGDSELGGLDIDNRVADHLAQAFLSRHGVDLRTSSEMSMGLWERAERAKRDLSARQSVIVPLSADALAMRVDIDRSQFNELIADLIERTAACMERALTSAGLRWAGIDSVLLVGGSSRIPLVRETIQRVTGQEPTARVNPDEVVACGAALRAALTDLREVVIPVAGVAPASPTGIVVRDVASHSVGVRATDPATGKESNSIIIPRLTEVPCERRRPYRTVADNQRRIEIFLLQGEDPDPFSPEVEPIGRVVMDDLPPMPAGEVVVDIVLRYDANGVIEVEARELVGGTTVRAQLLTKVGELDPEIVDVMKTRVKLVNQDLGSSGVDQGGAVVPPGGARGGELEDGTGPPSAAREEGGNRGEGGSASALDATVDYYSLIGVAPTARVSELEEALEESEGIWRRSLQEASDTVDIELAQWTLDTLANARLVLFDRALRGEYDHLRAGSEPDPGPPETVQVSDVMGVEE
jgi:molecular chaperone DnaK